ncbi:helix-turn-helix domain-containing protein [Psychrobium sp. 1_MG-2023]|uniref:helix-turn-helix domain-containing protein n=1 Tax=Psychrobium sp. 1_MG-2023 TaxID=3062624 RepID=UPI000C31D72C|nr:helix-turn-helix transcriptional regulator [Psychrobium sp. 1_MG-2023]MDP2560428.1 helix-turn-helix transcriptional regulator [Psychrobium sp. 1_MG-2023]PKF57913.1 XRE family transcriptional regulator [Alteromonadales bacterium alter-6D02]
MILAEKIIRLRKQSGWSQEELAEKMNISRQSVSKWESANSIPDLNRIIMLAEIFDVSTDFLLKDDIEVPNPNVDGDSKETGIAQVSLEQANLYVEQKMEASALTTKGVMLCVCSAVPLFFFMAMAETNRLNITDDIAAALGIVGIIVLVSIAVNFFIKTNQYESDTGLIDNEPFELAYGVHSVFSEKLQKFRATYNKRLSLSIFLFIFSFVPLMMAGIFSGGSDTTLMMLIVLIAIATAGLGIIIPVSAQFDAYNNVLKDTSLDTEKSKRTKRAEKLAAFYWPLLTAIYLGWSLWTLDWGVTWIVWPVGSILFVASLGLMELLDKGE